MRPFQFLAAPILVSALGAASPIALAQNESTNTKPADTKPAAPARAKAVVAEPAAIYAGQQVTLRWYFTGKKVTVAGGRFGAGQVVTGKTAISDKPSKTTRYTFTADYVGQKENPVTGKIEEKPLRAVYTVVVEVAPPLKMETITYRDRYGWKINSLKDWKRDPVSLADPANNALMYFQQEDDSVERMAVSILPAAEMTATDLMSKVQRSLSGNYEQIQVLSDQETTFAGVPAVLSEFSAMDISHPGTRTQSLVLAFVKDSRAYVLSARTAANKYKLRRPVLEALIRSFDFTQSTALK
jgi:hypothetical protein